MCCTYNLIPDLWYLIELHICSDLAQAEFYTAPPSKFGLVNNYVESVYCIEKETQTGPGTLPSSLYAE
jgi:hypothetical protein